MRYLLAFFLFAAPVTSVTLTAVFPAQPYQLTPSQITAIKTGATSITLPAQTRNLTISGFSKGSSYTFNCANNPCVVSKK